MNPCNNNLKTDNCSEKKEIFLQDYLVILKQMFFSLLTAQELTKDRKNNLHRNLSSRTQVELIL